MRQNEVTNYVKKLSYKIIVKTLKQNEKVGTGFAVANNIIITCYHVISDYDTILVGNKESEVVFKDKEKDIAILKVEINNEDSLILDENIEINDECYSYGYPKDFSDGSSLTYKFEGFSEDKNLEFLKLKDGQFQSGFSGSAILNLSTGKICGLISESRDTNTNLGGYGIPIKYVKEILENKKIECNNYDTKKHHALIDSFTFRLDNYYKKHFNKILLLNNTKKEFDDIYKYLKIIKYKEDNKKEEIIQVNQFFTSSTKILVYGEAGIGKTTLCKYIINNYLNGKFNEKYKYLIYIALRYWKSDGLKGAIRDNYFSLDINSESINLPENNKTIYIFDGLDELEEDAKIKLYKEIECYKIKNYLVTSRYLLNNELIFEQKYKIIGYTTDSIQKYVKKFFYNNNLKYKTLINYIKKYPKINNIVHIPLLLEIICIIWDEKPEKNRIITLKNLYENLIEKILKDFYEYKNNTKIYSVINRIKIIELLSKIAYYSNKSKKFIFDFEFLYELYKNKILYKDELNFFSETLIESGLLKVIRRKSKDILESSFEFLHLSIQEFFVAKYIDSLGFEESKKIIERYINTRRYQDIILLYIDFQSLKEQTKLFDYFVGLHIYDEVFKYSILVKIFSKLDKNEQNIKLKEIETFPKLLLKGSNDFYKYIIFKNDQGNEYQDYQYPFNKDLFIQIITESNSEFIDNLIIDEIKYLIHINDYSNLYLLICENKLLEKFLFNRNNVDIIQVLLNELLNFLQLYKEPFRLYNGFICYLYEEFVEVCIETKRNDNNFIKILFILLKLFEPYNENKKYFYLDIHKNAEVKIIKYLKNIKRNDDCFLYLLYRFIIKNYKNISYYAINTGLLLEILLKLKRNDSLYYKLLEKLLLKNLGYEFNIKICYELPKIFINNKKIIEKIIKLLNNNKLYYEFKFYIIKSFKNLKIKDLDIINIIRNEINNSDSNKAYELLQILINSINYTNYILIFDEIKKFLINEKNHIYYKIVIIEEIEKIKINRYNPDIFKEIATIVINMKNNDILNDRYIKLFISKYY